MYVLVCARVSNPFIIFLLALDLGKTTQSALDYFEKN